MISVKPRVFHIGETRIIEEGLKDYLDYIGVSDWSSDAPSDVEKLPEIYGRVCYRSFEVGLNPNVTRIRKENAGYIGNILKHRHGSVIEHSMLNFIFAGVSRVFTHELVRHRVGTAISQESLRYVRLEELGFWFPTVIEENEEALKIFVDSIEYLESKQVELAKIYKLDEEGTDFHFKKEVTSAMRRIAPDGLATTIGWSANPRTIRHILEMRTAPESEEEIRVVFGMVGELVMKRYPNLFQDFTVEMADGHPHYIPKYSKI